MIRRLHMNILKFKAQLVRRGGNK